MSNQNISPILRAAEILGGKSNLARAISALPYAEKISPQGINKWIKRVPSERCRQVEEVTHGAVSREELRPDIFGENPTEHNRTHMRRDGDKLLAKAIKGRRTKSKLDIQ